MMCGFLALPEDVLLDILSHFPPDPITSLDLPRQVIRRETLLSLSTVCQNLRRIFLPHLWQRVEVYSGMKIGVHTLRHSTRSYGSPTPSNHFAKELLRQLEVVTTQDPALAQHVQIVDIELNSSELSRVLHELGRCFSFFPKLHTVKVITRMVVEDTMTDAERAFNANVPYPQIRSAFLSPSIYPLLAACPNLKSLTAFGTNRFIFMFIKGLTALRELSGPLLLLNRWLVPFLLRAGSNILTVIGEIPSIQKITIFVADSMIYSSEAYASRCISAMQFFPNVRNLDLCCDSDSTWDDEWARSVKQFFLDLPPDHRHNLKEVIFSGSQGIEEVLDWSDYPIV